ncbi:MAG TPA: Gfo/Idh/MocA family oxidoreductase, partial [Caldilineaceae bacterium]|nr:Gfo/Idh/MocA family oxidoreductase [Caldilineaceae bacterium]
MNPVKIAFAGVGYMGQVAHLRNYVNRDDCQVVAIAEPRPELAHKVAQLYGVPKIYHDHRELITDPDVQAVVASQPHLRNGHLAIPLLRAGKYVFIEKPMAGSSQEAAAIQQAAEEGGAQVMVGLMKRHDTAVLAARARLQELSASGELGRLTRIQAHCFGGDWIHDALPPLSTQEGVPDDPEFKPVYPGGLDAEAGKQFQNYLNIMAHNFNLVRFLYPHPLSVQSAVGRRDNRLMHTAILTSADGVLVELAGG